MTRNLVEELRTSKQQATPDAQRQPQKESLNNSIIEINKVFIKEALNAYQQTDIGPALIKLYREKWNNDSKIDFILPPVFGSVSFNYTQLGIIEKNFTSLGDCIFDLGEAEFSSLKVNISWGKDPHPNENADLDYTYPTYHFDVAYLKDGSFSFRSADGETIITNEQWKQDDSVLGKMLGLCIDNPEVGEAHGTRHDEEPPDMY
jgi:hypothetical protein